jgi:multidrug efflux system outer membrane protein
MMQHITSSTFKLAKVAIITSLLAGCTVWPDYMRPKVAVPEKYSQSQVAGSEANSPVIRNWWTLYQDPVLNDLVEKALQNNTDLQLAAARIEEADAIMREAGAYLFPQINLDADATRTRVTEAGAFPVFASNPRNNYIVQLGTSFEIDFWGKLRKAKESARAQALSTRYAKDTVALSLSSQVVNNYLLLRSLESQIKVAQDSLKSREESLALTKRRLEGGVASALDVHQAEVATSTLKAQLAELSRMRSISLHQLAVLTGKLDLDVATADLNALPVPPVPPVGLPSSLMEARPDIRQAEQQMIAADANIGVAKAALYPTISLTAGFGGESLQLKDLLTSAARIWTGGVGLTLPIFDSGRLRSRVDQASAVQKQAFASYEGSIRNAFREVNDALVNLRQHSEREAALNQSQEAARKALQVSENRYKSGYSAYLDVLDAQRVYNDTALAFIQSRQARLTATVELFKALGGGWNAELEQNAQISQK